MNRAQTSALLADFDDPRLTELDGCERHARTLDALLAIAESPPFRRAHVRFCAPFRGTTPNPP